MKVFSFRATLLLLLFLFGLNQTTPAQEKGDVVSIRTELVQTDVTVVDRHGRFVDGLGREQFELRIDGAPVPIAFFERVGNEATASTRGRQIIFFIDDMHLAAESIEPVRKGLLHFIDNEKQPNDQVAIVSGSGQIGFLQQFSDQPAVLRAAVARLNKRPYAIQDTETVPLSEYMAYKIASGDRDAATYYSNELLRSLQFIYALPKYGGKGSGFLVGSENDQAERMVMQRVQSIVAQSVSNSLASLSTLETFMRSSSALPGRKIVFFISDGFLLHHRNGELANKLQRITDAAARAGGVIYAVDARAFSGRHQVGRLRIDAVAERFNTGEKAAFQSALNVLAENTGGQALLDKETLAGAVDNALRESQDYYVVAWRPEKEEQKIEKFRSLKVSVVGRPELTVRLARGYLDSATEMKQSVAKNVLPTRLALSFLNTPNNGMVLTASTEVAIESSVFERNNKAPAEVDLAGVVLDDQGKLKSSFKTRLTVNPLVPLSAEPAQAEGANVIYNYRTSLQPGIYQVRVAAEHKESGRVGRATHWIEIPDLAANNLILSSLLLDGRLIETKDADARTPQVQHSVARRFSRASRLGFLLFVYGAGRGGNQSPRLTADIQVVQNGRAVLKLSQLKVPMDATVDLARIPYGGSFPLRSLRAGNYVLQVTVTDHAGQKASQQIDFEIV